MAVFSQRPERWSRNCGSGGLGPSTHTAGDGYRPGVLESNWVEELSGQDLKASGRTLHGTGAPMTANSTQRLSFTPHGKVGEDLFLISQRQDRELANDGLRSHILMRHGDFLQPTTDCNAALNALTYGERRFLGEPSVQSYLWNESNVHSRTVPLKLSSLSLTRKKVMEWQQDRQPGNGFRTTSRTSSMSAALPAATHPHKQGTMRPSSGPLGGQPFSTGRKSLGLSVDECDKNYRRMGLRDTYCTFLTTPKH